jgi:hypothetical protein
MSEPKKKVAKVDNTAAEIGKLIKGCRADLIKAGKKLADQKKKLGYGKWLPWLEANKKKLGFGDAADAEGAAQRLIKLAKNPTLTSDLLWGNSARAKAVADQSKTIEGKATELKVTPPDPDEEDEDEEGADEEGSEEGGEATTTTTDEVTDNATPDVAAPALVPAPAPAPVPAPHLIVSDVLAYLKNKCGAKGENEVVVMKLLAKAIGEELGQMTVEATAEPPPAPAASAPEKPKRGRPKKTQATPPAPAEPAARAGTDADTDDSTAKMNAAHEASEAAPTKSEAAAAEAEPAS